MVYEEHTAGCSGHPGLARWPSDTGTDTLGRPLALGHWDTGALSPSCAKASGQGRCQPLAGPQVPEERLSVTSALRALPGHPVSLAPFTYPLPHRPLPALAPSAEILLNSSFYSQTKLAVCPDGLEQWILPASHRPTRETPASTRF